jgi:short-subunit dehydrogenase
LITGASSGIGEALARNLAARGVHVILTARRLHLLKKIAMEIQSSGGNATAVRLDVAQADAAAKAIAALDRKFGVIDLVIANAGVGIKEDPSYGWAAVKKVADINYTGALATLTTLLPAMVARKNGHVVAISSLAGYTALPDAAGYSSPKAGLSRFMECLALDLQNTGVCVSTVHVGFVATPMVAKSTIPLPFLISAEAAAEYIVQRLARKKREINFPKPMVVLVTLLAWLPFWVKKLVARRYWRSKSP